MEVKVLIKQGIINNLKVIKRTYSVRGFTCIDRKEIFYKIAEKNILKVLNYMKSFNSSLININCNNYNLEYNTNKTDYKLNIDNKIIITITSDEEKRIILKGIVITDDIIKA